MSVGRWGTATTANRTAATAPRGGRGPPTRQGDRTARVARARGFAPRGRARPPGKNLTRLRILRRRCVTVNRAGRRRVGSADIVRQLAQRASRKVGIEGKELAGALFVARRPLRAALLTSAADHRQHHDGQRGEHSSKRCRGRAVPSVGVGQKNASHPARSCRPGGISPWQCGPLAQPARNRAHRAAHRMKQSVASQRIRGSPAARRVTTATGNTRAVRRTTSRRCGRACRRGRGAAPPSPWRRRRV